MKKSKVVSAMLHIIHEKALEYDLEIVDNGYGHAFDHSFWNFKDDSKIPSVIAHTKDYSFEDKKGYSIELRSFWGSPELDIRRYEDGKSDLLVLNYSDIEYDENGKFYHSEDFYVNEVRCDSHNRYKECIADIYELIEEIEEYE